MLQKIEKKGKGRSHTTYLLEKMVKVGDLVDSFYSRTGRIRGARSQWRCGGVGRRGGGRGGVAIQKKRKKKLRLSSDGEGHICPLAYLFK